VNAARHSVRRTTRRCRGESAATALGCGVVIAETLS
jgi:hypothetical protein